MAIEKVNLAEKLARIREYWSPNIAGEINDSYLKLVKFQGEFVWSADSDSLRWSENLDSSRVYVLGKAGHLRWR